MLQDLIALGKAFRDDPVMAVATFAGMGAGAVLGAVAFFQSWLG